jgi:hypothetical protein
MDSCVTEPFSKQALDVVRHAGKNTPNDWTQWIQTIRIHRLEAVFVDKYGDPCFTFFWKVIIHSKEAP